MNEKESLSDDLNDDDSSVIEVTDTDGSDDSVSMSDSIAAMADKEAERLRLQADIEAFLACGGKIVEVPTNVINDPPKKPVSKTRLEI